MESHIYRLVASRVRELVIQRFGDDANKGKVLGEILGLSASSGHRLFDSGNYSLGQLDMVARYFGVTLSDVTDGTPGERICAITSIENGRFECSAIVSARKEPLPGELMAVETPQGWIVTTATDRDRSGYFVETMTIDTTPLPSSGSVVVVEDDFSFRETICDVLELAGFHATPCPSAAALILHLSEQRFDAAILDWDVGDATGDQLIKLIHSSNSKHAALIILTGNSGIYTESIASVIKDQNVEILLKPCPNEFIAAKLEKALRMKS